MTPTSSGAVRVIGGCQFPAGRAVRGEQPCSPQLRGTSSGSWDLLSAVGGCLCHPQPRQELWKAGPCLSPARTHVAAGSVPSVPLCQPCVTFRRWHPESSGGCAALPHGPRGPARLHGHCRSEGKNHIFSSNPPSPFPVWSFFRAKGKKRTWPGFPASLCSCSFIPLFPAAANGFAWERSVSVPAPFFLFYCLNIRAGRLRRVNREGKRLLLEQTCGQVSCRALSCRQRSQLLPRSPAQKAGVGHTWSWGGNTGARQVSDVHLEMMERLPVSIWRRWRGILRSRGWLG